LHGWEDDDYEANQRKLEELAKKLAGRNRQFIGTSNPEGNSTVTAAKEPNEHPAMAKAMSPKRKRSQSSRSRSKSLEKLRKKASSSKKP
jgi:hypothetical protein